MTTPHPADDLPSKACSQEQCMLYLLGELDAQQSAAFEQRLASSPELSEQLLRQADVITGLSVIRPQGTSMPASIMTYARWSIVASIVAIAACLAIMVLGVRPLSLDEDLLIARAWADSQLNHVSEDFGFAELDMEDALPVAVESSDIDSTLSWMFIAVSANADLGDEGTANDG